MSVAFGSRPLPGGGLLPLGSGLEWQCPRGGLALRPAARLEVLFPSLSGSYYLVSTALQPWRTTSRGTTLLCYPVNTLPTRACGVVLNKHVKCPTPREVVQRHPPWSQTKTKLIPRSPPWPMVAMAVLGRPKVLQDGRAARLTLQGRERTLERPHSGSHPRQRERELHVAVGQFSIENGLCTPHTLTLFYYVMKIRQATTRTGNLRGFEWTATTERANSTKAAQRQKG